MLAAIAFAAVGMYAPYARALQAAPSQSPPASAPPAATAPAPSSIEEPLRQALDQVGTALNEVRIDHWKLPKRQKAQFQDDARSIQRDLANTLPGLFAAMRQSPQAMQPQWAMMHNVNALYDVLIRIGTAAEISGGKDDAALLARVTQQLEATRNRASTQMLHTSSARDQDLARFKQEAQTVKERKSSTIVVNNDATHRKTHRKTASHRKPH